MDQQKTVVEYLWEKAAWLYLHTPRPWKLLMVAVAELCLVVQKDWLLCLKEAFVDAGFWSDSVAPIILASVPAFLLWKWRNEDKESELKHASETIGNAIHKHNRDDYGAWVEWALDKKDEEKMFLGVYRLSEFLTSNEDDKI